MATLETSYLGLKLRNPIIISSSGLSNSIEKIIELEKQGAGAIVLKSLFEEQISYEASMYLASGDSYPEAEDYIRNYAKANSVAAYLELIKKAKQQVTIPIIASISCVSSNDWIQFTKGIEEAGADAIELNIHILPTDANLSSLQTEEKYLKIVEEVKKSTKLPVAVKIGPNFTNLPAFVNQLYFRKVQAVVLFNRFYQPDIHLDDLSFTSASVFSNPADLRNTLRWVGIIGAQSNLIELSASTGVHDGAAALKLLLAGAKTVQICSILYKNGLSEIGNILNEMTRWMDEKGFKTIADFNGKLNYKNIGNPAVYERSQFMKYFSSHE